MPPPRPPCVLAQVLAKVRQLTLDDGKVTARERARWAAGGGPATTPPLAIRAAYASLCWALDVMYAGRPIERFWILETVARMPYFVYISMVGRRWKARGGQRGVDSAGWKMVVGPKSRRGGRQGWRCKENVGRRAGRPAVLRPLPLLPPTRCHPLQPPCPLLVPCSCTCTRAWAGGGLEPSCARQGAAAAPSSAAASTSRPTPRRPHTLCHAYRPALLPTCIPLPLHHHTRTHITHTSIHTRTLTPRMPAATTTTNQEPPPSPPPPAPPPAPQVHFAEEWNELHHLQIMEALGGDLRWGDRFLAEHAAVFYYW